MQLQISSGGNAGQTVEVTGSEFTIGREAGNSLVLNDGKASRRHAALKLLPDGRATLYDMGSSNGTFVNGQRVQSTVLSGGEQIQIGDSVMSAVVESTAPAGAGGATSLGAVPPPQPQAAPQAPVPQQPAPPTEQYIPAGQQQQPPGGFQQP